MTATMLAAVIYAPGEYRVESVPVPECPTDGLLLRVLACGLCGSDLRTLRNGHHRVTLPWIVGHEIAGEVVSVGQQAAGGWQVGDRMAVAPLAYCGVCDFCRDGRLELCDNYREIGQAWHGGFAEYIAIPAACLSLGTILPIPSGVDPVLAAISEPVSSCVHAQEVGMVGLGDTVVIIGSGPIGCIHASLARARGADTVIVADIQASRLELCTPFAPDHLIDSSTVDLVDEVRRLTGGKGADVVICATPAPVTQVQGVEMARKGGRILFFGGLPSDRSQPGIDTNLIHYRALHVLGTTIFAPRHQRIALQLLTSGRIFGDRLITHRLPLTSFVDGARLALDGQALKVVFIN